MRTTLRNALRKPIHDPITNADIVHGSIDPATPKSSLQGIGGEALPNTPQQHAAELGSTMLRDAGVVDPGSHHTKKLQ